MVLFGCFWLLNIFYIKLFVSYYMSHFSINEHLQYMHFPPSLSHLTSYVIESDFLFLCFFSSVFTELHERL